MRVIVLAGLAALAGCTPRPPDERDAGPDNTLPTPRVPRDARVGAGDLYDFYRREVPFGKHPREGGRVVCRFTWDHLGTRDGGGKPALLDGSGDGSRRPRLVARLADERGFREGRVITSTPHVEGVLRGPVAFAAAPWAGLAAHDGFAADHFVLIDDARVVAAPGD